MLVFCSSEQDVLVVGIRPDVREPTGNWRWGKGERQHTHTHTPHNYIINVTGVMNQAFMGNKK